MDHKLDPKITFPPLNFCSKMRDNEQNILFKLVNPSITQSPSPLKTHRFRF